MVSTVRDSTKRHCLPPLCGKEAVKFRWGSVACSGRSGRGECGLFRWYCCAFAVLNIGMGVLARQVQATMLAGDGLAARTGTPFWRWMPLPMQDCNPGCALDKNNLHVLLERRVMIHRGDSVFVRSSIDTMFMVHTGQHQLISSKLWAPDPGGVPKISLCHQFLPSPRKFTMSLKRHALCGDNLENMRNYRLKDSQGEYNLTGISSTYESGQFAGCYHPKAGVNFTSTSGGNYSHMPVASSAYGARNTPYNVPQMATHIRPNGYNVNDGTDYQASATDAYRGGNVAHNRQHTISPTAYPQTYGMHDGYASHYSYPLMPVDDEGNLTEWLLSKMLVLVPDYDTARIQAQPLLWAPAPSHNEARSHSLCLCKRGAFPEYCKTAPGYLPTAIRSVMDSLLQKQDIAPHRIPPNDLLFLALESTVVDERTIEEIGKELKKRAHSDLGRGARGPGGTKANGSTSMTAQRVESNMEAGAASPSVGSNSVRGDEKELTGGSKRGKQGGNKTGAAGDFSGGRAL